MKREKRDEQSGHQAGDGSFSELHRGVNTTHRFSKPDVFHVCSNHLFVFFLFFLFIFSFLFQ